MGKVKNRFKIPRPSFKTFVRRTDRAREIVFKGLTTFYNHLISSKKDVGNVMRLLKVLHEKMNTVTWPFFEQTF